MATMNYDYHALKDAHNKLTSDIENYEANAKRLQETGDDLVATNNADGVKSTMSSFQEKQDAVIKIMRSALEQITEALGMARELHIANGGEE